jgi:DNA-binding transcriptional LysR family regulator
MLWFIIASAAGLQAGPDGNDPGGQGMNLILLKYFQVVAQENHITRASQKLNIAQPALSYSIARLESDLGVQLFDRVGRQIILNDCGKKLLERVNVILENWETARSEVKQYQREITQHVKIGVTSMMLSQNLIVDFKLKHPDILIKQAMVKAPQIIPAITQEKNDFVLSTIPVTDENISSSFLMKDNLYVLVSKDHALSKQKSVSIEDIAGEQFVSVPEGFALRVIVDEYFQKAGFEHNVVFECFPAQVPDLVSAHMGIAFISGSTLHRDIYPPTVVALPIEKPECHRSLFILWEKSRVFPEACRLFYEYALSYDFA